MLSKDTPISLQTCFEKADGVLRQVTMQCRQYSGNFIVMILIVAVVVRVLALFSFNGTVYWDASLPDEQLYHKWAVKILKGTFAGTEVFEFAPLPAYLIALVYKILYVDIHLIRWMNILLGVGICYLQFLIGKELFSPAVGVFSCLVAALYEPLILYSVVPLKTSLSVLLFSFVVFFFITGVQRGGWSKFLLLGLMLGALNNVRPNMFVVIPLIPLLVFWITREHENGLRRAVIGIALFFLGLGIVQAPFTLRNYLAAGEPSLTTTQIGVHLYLCNNFIEPRSIQFATLIPSQRGIQFTIEASRRVGRKLNASEASDYWKEETLRRFMEYPWQGIKHLWVKTHSIFNYYERGDHYQLNFLDDFVTFFQVPLFTLWMIFPLAFAGLFSGFLKRRVIQGLVLICILYGSTMVLFFVNSRLRLPLLVIAIPLAVAGTGQFWTFLLQEKKKSIKLFLAVWAFFLVLAFIPTYIDAHESGARNTHALLLYDRGRSEEAVRYWKQSSEIDSRFSSIADLSLFRTYYEKGQMDKAVAYLKKIDDLDSLAATKYSLVGDIFALNGAVEKAIASYRKSLHYNSGLLETRKKLINLLARTDPEKARQELERFRYIRGFYNLY